MISIKTVKAALDRLQDEHQQLRENLLQGETRLVGLECAMQVVNGLLTDESEGPTAEVNREPKRLAHKKVATAKTGRTPRNPERQAEILAKLKAGMSAREVAECVGVSVPTVYSVKARASKRSAKTVPADTDDDDEHAETDADADDEIENTEHPKPAPPASGPKKGRPRKTLSATYEDFNDDEPDAEPHHPAITPTVSRPALGAVDKPISPSELEMFKNRVEILLKSAKRLSYSQILAGCHLSPEQFAAVLKVAAVEKNEDGLYQIKSRIKAS